MHLADWFKVALAVLGGALSWLFGGWLMFVAVVFFLMVIDFVTGWMAGGINKELSSQKGFNGIRRKGMIMLVIVMAALLDYLLRTYVNANLAACLGIVCTFYAVNEGLSILENLGRAGVPYPEKLRDVILVLNKKETPVVPAPEAEDKEGF